MRMKHFLIILFLIINWKFSAQITDDFTDSEFISNPTWIGDDSVFTVVSVSGNPRLRSNKLITNSSYFLSTPSTQINEGQWEFFVNLQFNTSSANYVDIYLTSDNLNLLTPNLSGYFVRVGGTTDEVSLYKKMAGTSTKIIDGVDGVTNFSSIQLKIKVTKSLAGDWKLERDVSGSGNNYFIEGITNDLTLNSSAYFGFAITQSTASFFQKHFFDDVYIGPIIVDLTPPQLVSAAAISQTQIDVLFNEPLLLSSAEVVGNYVANPSLIIQSTQLDAVNPSLVHLILQNTMINGTTYQLTTASIADVNGNISGAQNTSFSFLISENPIPGDIIINEFMCDPSPSIGIPEVEYIELHNKSNKYFNLSGWKIGDASSIGTIQEGWIFPGEYKIICPSSNVDTFTMTVALPVTSFPSLNNAGDDIVLKDASGSELDRISYTSSWYNDPNKEDGGYSIELINPNDPCSDKDNWAASISSTGGTPGSINSIWNVTPDTEFPMITELVALSPNYLEVYFSEGMDSTLLTNATYTVNPLLNVQSVFVLEAHPTMVTLQFIENFSPSTIYSLFAENLGDCWLNQTNLSGSFVLPDAPAIGDVKINEILFDPYTNGSDWVELYNNSEKVIDLQNWQLANFDNDTIDNIKTITSHFFLKPQEYAVIGKDSVFVKQQYPFYGEGTFIYSETPSYNIDSSTVYLVYQNQIMDAVSYKLDWHFPLLDDTDGVSLERIDPKRPSSDSTNWHSAAEAIGFATPGLENSQFYPATQSGDFSFESSTISPDNDGFEDILMVNYEMQEPGLLGKFSIYDDRGRLIKTLFEQELLATNGIFSWDGITEENVKARIGTYVAVFEAFSINGGIQFIKRKAFVVSGKL